MLHFSFSDMSYHVCLLLLLPPLFYTQMSGNVLKLNLSLEQNKIYGLGYNSKAFSTYFCPVTTDSMYLTDSLHTGKHTHTHPTTFYKKSEMVLLVLNGYLKDFHLSAKFQILIMSNGSKSSSNINLRAYTLRRHQPPQSWVSSCLIGCDRATI